MASKETKAHSAIANILDFLKQPGLILLTGHVRPDGDALGATLALARTLRQQGCSVVATAEGADSSAASCLVDCEPVVSPAEAVKLPVARIVSLDCGTVTRLPDALQSLTMRLPVVNIDHHVTNTRFGLVSWVDPHASSTCELVWRLIRHAKWPIDRLTAEALWVGLVTDTGRFAYDLTQPKTLRMGADLLRYGVRTAWLNDRLYGSFDLKALSLKRRAFQSLEVWMDGRVAAVTLTHADFTETGCTKSDAEDIIEIPRSLRGSQVAFFFYETGEPDMTRVSMRTREPLDATQVAIHFSGGGHARAAGFTIHAPMAEAKAQIRKHLEKWLSTTT